MVYLLVVLHLKVHRSQVTSEGDLCGVETNSCLVVTNCLRGTGTFLRFMVQGADRQCGKMLIFLVK